MPSIGLLQIALCFGLILVCVKPLGTFMANVFEGRRTFLHPVLSWLENGIYKICGINRDEDQKWTTYALAMLCFSVVGLVLTYALLRLQGLFPFNPQGYNGSQMTPDLA